ncbi:hypothetical protein DDE82_008391 [Stemphylium lycopersici]|nr:hypothetical protein TW65_07596 [Stemphylium lycopersici]RAQ99319.1 hypothetical protein DDE82_008391 [Stemphylium lycopersici]
MSSQLSTLRASEHQEDSAASYGGVFDGDKMVSMTYVQEDDDDFKCRVEQFDELLACCCSLWAVTLVVGAAAHGTPSPYHAESCIFTAICITTAYAKWEEMHREWMHQIDYQTASSTVVYTLRRRSGAPSTHPTGSEEIRLGALMLSGLEGKHVTSGDEMYIVAHRSQIRQASGDRWLFRE